MNKKSFFAMILSMALLLAAAMPAAAQADADYLLTINKVIGTNLGSQINGTFKLGINGDRGAVQSVEYRLDGQAIGTANAEPFTLVFKTTEFAAGTHQLSALVTTRDGRSFETPARTFKFLSAGESGQVINNVVLPILGILFAVVAVMMLLQFAVFRNRPLTHLEPGTPRDYGIKGGTICPNCNRPFAFHWWAINLLPTMRYDRCDYCGKWGVRRRYAPDVLREAERLEAVLAKPESAVAEKSEEDKLQDLMDQTKYTK